MNNIGIVGLGYVGKAVEAAFSDKYKILSYDINQKCSEKDLKSVVENSDIIFVCVPTPMRKNGSCFVDILSTVINDINNFNLEKDVVIKSTIPPSTSEKLQKENSKINIIFNPEFMTEANFYRDFLDQKRIILSGTNLAKVEQLYSINFPQSDIIKLPYGEAELIKYFSNTFLATKVSFANEIYSLCNKLGINYKKVVSALILDERIGNSHLAVPGPDGKLGFGGSCFPKDFAALIHIFKENDINSPILNAVWERNNKIDRKEQDWKNLKGRAVIDE
jgi:nucleotide sugar dehydrogenase